jgi:hypothetical protein
VTPIAPRSTCQRPPVKLTKAKELARRLQLPMFGIGARFSLLNAIEKPARGPMPAG